MVPGESHLAQGDYLCNAHDFVGILCTACGERQSIALSYWNLTVLWVQHCMELPVDRV